MPIYEYQCRTCGHDFEKLQKISAEAPPCPKCGEEVRKKVSASAFVLKGSGWYRDHYGLKKPTKEGSSGAAGASTPSGGDSKGADTSTKPATSAPAESSAKASPAKASSSEG